MKVEVSNGFLIPCPVSGPGAISFTYTTGTTKRFANDADNGNVDGDGVVDNEDSDNDGDTEPSSISSPSFEMDNATMKIDDGGSNLTDRFKYKVHALMGDYDPTEGVADDEDQDGNIMKALLTFPTQHVFDVVGKVSSSDDDKDGDNDNDDDGTNNDYAEKVKKIVFETTGDENIECDIIPRGKKYTKVRCKAMVESTTMINTIYDELGQMESTIMKF